MLLLRVRICAEDAERIGAATMIVAQLGQKEQKNLHETFTENRKGNGRNQTLAPLDMLYNSLYNRIKPWDYTKV